MNLWILSLSSGKISEIPIMLEVSIKVCVCGGCCHWVKRQETGHTLTFVAFQCVEKHSIGGNRRRRRFDLGRDGKSALRWFMVAWGHQSCMPCKCARLFSKPPYLFRALLFGGGGHWSPHSLPFFARSRRLCADSLADRLSLVELVSLACGLCLLCFAFGWLSFKPRLYRKCGQNGLMSPPCTLPCAAVGPRQMERYLTQQPN